MVRLLDEEGPKWYVMHKHPSNSHTYMLIVHSFVCVRNMRFPTLFRTWTSAANQAYDCTLIEAARATTAAPTFLKLLNLENQLNKGTSMVDCGAIVRYNTLWKKQTSCILIDPYHVLCRLELG